MIHRQSNAVDQDSFTNHLDNTIPSHLREMGVPGAAIALIEDAKLSAIKTYGFADVARKIPISENTLFQVASISKAVTAWGVMKLVEEGKVELDAPIERYLHRWHLPKSEFDCDQVTVRRLLAHTAGISLEGFKGINPEHPIPSLEDTLSGQVPDLDQYQIDYTQRWNPTPDIHREQKPVYIQYSPGETFNYSGGGFTLLELMIEEVSGESFSSYMKEKILAPLGMTESSFELIESKRPAFATPYTAKGEALCHYGFNGKAAGGMYSNIVELAQFACAEMEGPGGEPAGRGILSPASISTMANREAFAETLMGMDFYSGLGHFVIDMGEHECVHHTGGNVGWRTVYAVIPKVKAGLCILINSEAGNDLWTKIMQDWAQSLELGASNA